MSTVALVEHCRGLISVVLPPVAIVSLVIDFLTDRCSVCNAKFIRNSWPWLSCSRVECTTICCDNCLLRVVRGHLCYYFCKEHTTKCGFCNARIPTQRCLTHKCRVIKCVRQLCENCTI